MTALKHIAHGLIVYLASIISMVLTTHVTVDRTFLISLIPGAVAALASSLGGNVTADQASSTLHTVERLIQTVESRIVSHPEAVKPATTKQ